jgi:hypothetical protein
MHRWLMGLSGHEDANSGIEGTACEVIAKLAKVPADGHVRAMVSRPRLSPIARRLQSTALASGMTNEVHDDLWQSLKNDR